MDKFLDFFRLEAVENFEPECKRKVSGKTELVIRGIVHLLLASVFWCLNSEEELAKLIYIAYSGLSLIELMWGGLKQFEYIQDIIIHIVTIIVFAIVTMAYDNHFIGFVLMGLTRVFTEFENRNLYNVENLDAEKLEEWQSYSARNNKSVFVMLSLISAVIFKLFGLI